MPLPEGTKAASLDGPSSLRLTEDLPMLDGATALYPLYAAFALSLTPIGLEAFVFFVNADNPNAGRLIEWILSDQGQSLVLKTGYTPLPGGSVLP